MEEDRVSKCIEPKWKSMRPWGRSIRTYLQQSLRLQIYNIQQSRSGRRENICRYEGTCKAGGFSKQKGTKEEENGEKKMKENKIASCMEKYFNPLSKHYKQIGGNKKKHKKQRWEAVRIGSNLL